MGKESFGKRVWIDWKKSNMGWDHTVTQADIPTTTSEKIVRSRFVFGIKYNADGEILSA